MIQKSLIFAVFGLSLNIYAQDEIVHGDLTVRGLSKVERNDEVAIYPSLVSRGDIFQSYRNRNNVLEFGVAGGLNTRRAWILSRHSSINEYTKYYSTLHLQPDAGGDKSQYRGIAIGYDPSSNIDIGAHLAVNGKVGIGTLSPNTKLHINSIEEPEDLYPPSSHNDYLTPKDYDLLYLQQSGNGEVGPSIFMKGFNNGNSFSGRITLLESGGANGDIAFLTSSSSGYNQEEVMRITSKGNVGIGTSTIPSGYKMAITGKLITEEVKIEAFSNWPDYVFKKDFELPTLKEVESHIKDKGHLENIPSASDVKKEGFYLGEMDAKLLQKIEELTLYTIKQQKEIEILKLQNDKIKELEEENKILKSLVNRVTKLENKIKE